MAASSIERELAILLTGRDVSASRAVKGVSRELKTLSHVSRGTRTAIGNVERGVVIGATAAVGAIGYAVKAAMDWESAFAGVAKTIDGDVSQIGVDIRKMATEIPVAATELAGIAEAAGALGVAKGDITEFTRVVAILAVTTDLTSSAAADALGHLRTNLRLTGDDFTHLGNAVVYLGNNGASTESQILGMTESVSGASKIIGLSTQQTLGWAAALANTGEEVEAGGTSLQKFFLETFKMVNAGGAKLKVLAKVSGQSAATFKKAYQKDASGALSKFIVQLGKLSKAEQAATLKKLGFTDIRITRALLKLLGNTDNLTDSLSGAEKGWKDNSAATVEAEKRFKTTTAQLQLLKNNVQEAAITVGSELLPQVRELSDQGIDWLQAHPEEIAEFSRDLAKGIREAVTWAQELDWEAIGSGVRAGADAAKTLVDAFLSLPPEVIAFLGTGFAANKFTGGAVVDIAGDLTKGVFGQFFARGAPGNPMWVASVNGGIGGPGAGGKGGLPGIVPPVPLILAGAALAVGVSGDTPGGFTPSDSGSAIADKLADTNAQIVILQTAVNDQSHGNDESRAIAAEQLAAFIAFRDQFILDSQQRVGHPLTEGSDLSTRSAGIDSLLAATDSVSTVLTSTSDRTLSALDAIVIAGDRTSAAVMAGQARDAASVVGAINAKQLSVVVPVTVNTYYDARRAAAATYRVEAARSTGRSGGP